jgi:hypothetical protein
VITAVVPLFVPEAGGAQVTLTGTDLGSGADITAVLLCDVAVTTIVSQSPTQVVVEAAALSGTLTGYRAETRSAAFGVARSSPGSFFYSVASGALPVP